MAWTDRPYYRDRDSGPMNPLIWLLYGSVPLFTAFGIRVRTHAFFILLIMLALLFGMYGGQSMAARVQSMTMLFGIVLLHEFGHCFAARWTGGEADEILMTPLGGMAMTSPQRKPIPTLITVLGGPAVNVLICLITGLAMYAISRTVMLSPESFVRGRPAGDWSNVYSYLYWAYATSFWLLIFNMLPIYPLDGGQTLQCVLWKYVGYYKATLFTVNAGMWLSALLIVAGLAGLSPFGAGLLVILIAISCFYNCMQMRRHLHAEGPWGFQEEDSYNYASAAMNSSTRTKRRTSWAVKRRQKRLAKLQAADRDERERVDAILAKVSAQGMQSLTRAEKRDLRKATEHQRERDTEMSKLK